MTNRALSLLMKHLVIGQRPKAPNFSIFIGPDTVVHWAAFRNHDGSTFTENDRNKHNYRIGSERSKSLNRTRLCGRCIAVIAGQLFRFDCLDVQSISRAPCCTTLE